MTKKIEPYDVEEIASHIDNDRYLLEILQEDIENLDGKRLNNAYTPNEIMNEVGRLTPRFLAICDILLDSSITNYKQLTKLVNDSIHDDE